MSWLIDGRRGRVKPICLLLVFVVACGTTEPRGPASAVDIQARIDAPTASVHDEAAVRALLGRGVAQLAVPREPWSIVSDRSTSYISVNAVCSVPWCAAAAAEVAG